MGISPQQTTNLVNRSWLQRLAKGAYLLRGDEPTREGLIAYLSRRAPGLHVGGATALEWYRRRHEPPFRSQISLWGERPLSLATWIDISMACSYQTTAIFDDGLARQEGLAPFPDANPHVLVSSPERALLELASDVGKQGLTLDDACRFTERLVDLRRARLDALLSHCMRVKVIKVVRELGARGNHPWLDCVQAHIDRLGPAKRWSRKPKNGPRLTL